MRTPSGANPTATSCRSSTREFVELLRTTGAEVFVTDPIDGLVDAVYTHDPCVMTPYGAVLLQMRKPVRSPEPAAMREDFDRLGVPVLGSLDRATLSVTAATKCGWTSERCSLAVDIAPTPLPSNSSVRCSEPHGVNVVALDLPHYLGPSAVLHLMSVISPISHDLAVVYEPLAPVALIELLDERGIARITVDEDEMLTQGANILAVAPGEVVLAAGNDKVRAKLDAAGVKVHEFDGADVAVKGDGGPTCLTQPLWRA